MLLRSCSHTYLPFKSSSEFPSSNRKYVVQSTPHHSLTRCRCGTGAAAGFGAAVSAQTRKHPSTDRLPWPTGCNRLASDQLLQFDTAELPNINNSVQVALQDSKTGGVVLRNRTGHEYYTEWGGPIQRLFRDVSLLSI